MSEREYWLGFSLFSGIGPKRFHRLISHFGSAKSAWMADTLTLSEVLGQVLSAKFETFRKKTSIEAYLGRLSRKKVGFITRNDVAYPLILAKIPTAPFVLYIKSSAPFDFNALNPTIAIVGTRKITSYGREVTEQFTQGLVLGGCSIVSGLALGVDAVAHATTVENKGITIAVLGCGVDCCTPMENEGLYNRILASGGAIISEVPMGYLPTKGSFPSRNRIVAGLSRAVLVTEGAEDSGSLITADLAFSYNRKVFAVPGAITSLMSKGPYKLIEKGAKLVTKAEDILSYLHVQTITNGSSVKSIRFGSKEEEIVGKLLSHQPLTFDQLVRETGLSSSQIGSLLSMMEIKGILRTNSDSTFSLIS